MFDNMFEGLPFQSNWIYKMHRIQICKSILIKRLKGFFLWNALDNPLYKLQTVCFGEDKFPSLETLFIPLFMFYFIMILIDP